MPKTLNLTEQELADLRQTFSTRGQFPRRVTKSAQEGALALEVLSLYRSIKEAQPGVDFEIEPLKLSLVDEFLPTAADMIEVELVLDVSA